MRRISSSICLALCLYSVCAHSKAPSSAVSAKPLSCADLSASIQKMEQEHAKLQQSIEIKKAALATKDQQLVKEGASLDIKRDLIEGATSEVTALMLDGYDRAVDAYNRKYDALDKEKTALNALIQKLNGLRETGAAKMAQLVDQCPPKPGPGARPQQESIVP